MKKNRSVVAILIASFLAVWIVPVIMGIFIYISYDRVLMKNIEKSNDYILYNKSVLLDDVVNRVNELTYMVSVKPELISMAEYRYPYTPQQQYVIYEFMNKWLKYYNESTANVKSIYIYLPKSDMILANNQMTSKKYFDAVYSGTPEEYSLWLERLVKRQSSEFFDINIAGTKRILHVFKAVPALLGDNSPSIVIELNEAAFFNDSVEGENSEFYVTDEFGNKIYSSQKDDSDLNKLFTDENIDDENYIISKIKSRETGITYVFVQDKKFYNQESRHIRDICILMIAFCCVLSFIIIKFFVRYNSKPIKNIVSELNSNGLYSENGNEYKFIREAINEGINKSNSYKDIISTQKKYLRDDLLMKVLRSNSPINASLLKTFDIAFSGSIFIIILISVNEEGDIFFEKSDTNSVELAIYALENIFDELLAETKEHYVFSHGGIIHCIINYNEYDDNTDNKLMAIMEQSREFIKKNLNISYTVAISSPVEDANCLSEAYSEALKILEYKYIYPSKNVLRNDILQDGQERFDYKYSLKKEQQAINYIKDGNYNDAVNILNEALEISKDNTYMSLPLAKCMVFDILCTLLKISEEIMPEESVMENKLDIYSRIVNCTDVSKVRIEVDDIIKQFYDYLETYGKKRSNGFIAEKAKHYVDDEYGNENLTILSIAERLGVTPNYLSAIFKQNYDMSLFDYISLVRVEKSKELLKNTNISIDKIAENVGYSNGRTFSRTFARLEGITPSKYRHL